MRRFLLGAGALVLLLVGSQSAHAGHRWGGGYGVGFGGAGFGVNYTTRVGNSGFLSVGYGRGFGGYGWGYPGYGWGPGFGYGVARPAFYRPAYYVPTVGYGYWRGGRWCW